MFNGVTSLVHTIENYENYTVPTWVSLDSINFELNCSVPQVTSNTDYHFRIKTSIASSSTVYYKIVNLTVLN